MIPLLILVLLVVAAVVVWRLRVRLLARVLGQSESRVKGHLDRRR